MLILGFFENLCGYHFGDLAFYVHNPKQIYIPSGLFGNPNFYGAFLAICIPLPIFFIQTSTKISMKGIGIIIILSILYLLIQTHARISMVATLVELIIFFIFFREHKIINIKFFTIVFIFFLGIYWYFHESLYNIYQKVTIQLLSLLNFNSTYLNSNQIRLNLIYNGIEFVHSTYGFGVGAGNEPFWQANFGLYAIGNAITSHSWWLEIFTNYGIFIFLGFIAIYSVIIKDLFKIYKKTKNASYRYIAQVLFLSIISLTIIGFGIPMITYYPNWMIFAICLSFINFFNRTSEDEEP